MHISEAMNEAMIDRGAEYFCFTTIAGKRRLAKVVKFNQKSCWLKIMKGAKSFFIIKKKKAGVRVAFIGS